MFTEINIDFVTLSDVCRVQELSVSIVQEQLKYILNATAPRYTAHSACSKFLRCGWYKVYKLYLATYTCCTNNLTDDTDYSLLV